MELPGKKSRRIFLKLLQKHFILQQSGRPGPVLIDITKDAQLEKLDFKYKKCDYIRSYNPHIPLHTKAIESAAIMINHAERPLILAGHGVLLSGAENELKEFAEKTGIPVALTLLGLSGIPFRSPVICRNAWNAWELRTKSSYQSG